MAIQKKNVKKENNELPVKMSLTAVTSGLDNVIYADRIKTENVGEEKEVLWCLRDKRADLESYLNGTGARLSGS